MSLSRGDKDCIDAYMAVLMRAVHNLTSIQAKHVVDISRGTEARRKAAARHYAKEIRLPEIEAELTQIERRKAVLTEERDKLLHYIG